VVAYRERGGQNAKHQERLCFALVRHVVLDGVLQEVDLKKHLRQDQAQQNGRVAQLVNRVQVRRHPELRDVDGADAEPPFDDV